MSKYPKTLDEAVDFVLSRMDEKSKETLKNTPKDELCIYHFSAGIDIRYQLNLWHNEELLRNLSNDSFFPVHPDDASGIIIEAVWERLQNQGKKAEIR